MSAATIQWNRYEGDTDSVVVKLGGLAVMPVGPTLAACVIKNGVRTELTAPTLLVPADFSVSVPLNPWLTTATEGVYELRVMVNGATWPENGRAEITVEGRGRAPDPPVVIP